MDVIRVIRRFVRADKIGHGGTLDPFATGVLPLLFNRATRLSDQIMAGDKEYEGTLMLGQSFDTQDMTGTPISELQAIPALLSLEDVQKAANGLVGEILQTPPQYSAVKRMGRPLYDYARKGEAVHVEPRPVRVMSFDIEKRFTDRQFKFRVQCSKGTYVRTLIHDLGQKLGLGAVVETLVRVKTGDFHLDEAVQLSTLKYISDIQNHLKPLSKMIEKKVIESKRYDL